MNSADINANEVINEFDLLETNPHKANHAGGRGNKRRIRKNGRPHGGKRLGSGRKPIYPQGSYISSIRVPFYLWAMAKESIGLINFIRIMWAIFESDPILMDRLKEQVDLYAKED